MILKEVMLVLMPAESIVKGTFAMESIQRTLLKV